MKSYISLMDPSQLDQFKNNHTLEINPNHKLIIGLNKIRKIDLASANTIVRQLLDNTLLSCGLLTDPSEFVSRVNRLMEISVEQSLNRYSVSDSKEAHRPTQQTEKQQSQDKESILKDAYGKMKEGVRSESSKAKVEVGPDGNPIIR